ncbi:hypothetical protein ACX40Y_02200 [Sphingomonas sp. RS6]
MNRSTKPVLVSLSLLLAACNGGTSVSIDANDDNASAGNAVIETDSDGRIQIKAPGFQGEITLPQMPLDAKDFEVSGVRLYPGSTIQSLRAATQDRDGDKSGRVRIAFQSPASAETVRDWFRDNMTKQGFKVTSRENNLAGTTDDGEPFALELTPAGPNKTKGLMQVGN